MSSETKPETTALTVQNGAGTMLECVQFDKLLAAADYLVKSGFLPEAINTKEKAAAIILTGRELGIPTMQALRQIEVIKGKPTVKPELMLARAYQLVPGFSHEIVERSDKQCVIKFCAKGRKDYTHKFTFEDARAMLLADKDNYKKQPATMLFWRCTSGGLRAFCPQVTGTLYTPEELDPDIVVSEDGEIVRRPQETRQPERVIPQAEVKVSPPAPAVKPTPVAQPVEEPAKPKATRSRTPAPVPASTPDPVPVEPKPDEVKAAAFKLLTELDPYDDPTGDKLDEAKLAKILETFQRYNMVQLDLEDWEKLDAPLWTESVRINLLALNKLLKTKTVTKDHVREFIDTREARFAATQGK